MMSVYLYRAPFAAHCQGCALGLESWRCRIRRRGAVLHWKDSKTSSEMSSIKGDPICIVHFAGSGLWRNVKPDLNRTHHMYSAQWRLAREGSATMNHS
jgi:hypothetical protein